MLTGTIDMYRSIFENAVEGIFQSTPAGHYLQVNPALARMYGYSSPEDLMHAVTNIEAQLYVNPQRRRDFIELMAQFGQVKDFQSEIYRKDGAKIWIAEHVRAVRDTAGRILYYEGFVIDITQIKKADAKRHQLELQLHQAQKMEAIGRLAGGIAHDFNNILGAMLGYTQLARQVVGTDHKISNYLQSSLEAGDRAKKLIAQILTFSRRAKPQKALILLQPVIKDVVQLLRATFPDNIRIAQTVCSQPKAIQGDPDQLHRMLMNLCTNACQAMKDKGGLLTVTLNVIQAVGTEDDPYSPTPPLKAGEFLRLRVEDQGCGIPEELLECIFEPYFSTKSEGDGTGLGLATVHGIVQEHNGHLGVTSQVGQGTAFEIFLPVHRSYSPPEDPPNEGPRRNSAQEEKMDDELMFELRGLICRLITGGLDLLRNWLGRPAPEA